MPAFNPTDKDFDAYGEMLASTKFATSLIGSMILIVQLLMVLSILIHFFALPAEKRRQRLGFILISLLIFATSSIDTCTDIWLCFRVLLAGGPAGISYARVNPKIYEANWTISFVGDVLLAVMIVAGDALMLWRCFVLWSDKKWVVIFPTLCFLSTIGLTIVDKVWLMIITDHAAMVEKSRKLDIALLSLTVGTNIVVTLLILLRVAMTWSHVRKAFPDQKRPPMYTDVVSILVESATPLAFFGILLLITRGIRTSPATHLLEAGRVSSLRGIVAWLYYGFCALSPQMMIYRVTIGKSWTKTSQASGAVLSQPIRFARTTPGAPSETSEESGSV